MVIPWRSGKQLGAQPHTLAPPRRLVVQCAEPLPLPQSQLRVRCPFHYLPRVTSSIGGPLGYLAGSPAECNSPESARRVAPEGSGQIGGAICTL